MSSRAPKSTPAQPAPSTPIAAPTPVTAEPESSPADVFSRLDSIPEGALLAAASAEPCQADASEVIDREASVASLDQDTIAWMIAEAAYYKAEQRGFIPGHDGEDWLSAEAEIMARLGAQ